MHENNFGMSKNENLPVLDMVYPALISDLDERGLLDSTLVVVMGEMGEMGRPPGVSANAGPSVEFPRHSLTTRQHFQPPSTFESAANPVVADRSPGRTHCGAERLAKNLSF